MKTLYVIAILAATLAASARAEEKTKTIPGAKAPSGIALYAGLKPRSSTERPTGRIWGASFRLATHSSPLTTGF